MSVISLGYIHLTTEGTLGEWKNFATSVLGAAAVERDDELLIRVDEKAFRIAVTQADSGGLASVGLDVGDAAGLDLLRQKLAEAGYAVREGSAEEARRRSVIRLLHCNDPSGTPLELFYGQTYVREQFVSPLGVRFVTGDLGLGHVLLRAGRYDDTLAFYRDILGFRISDVWNGKEVTATFLRCNARHHSIALRKADDEGGFSLGHFMLQVDDVNTVGRAQEYGQEHLAMTIGRHFNDEM
ncbi:hypothetical protein A3731_33385, partial [Roseovarius sp. HI0049]